MTSHPTSPATRGSRVMDESELVRERIQSALFEMLRERRSVWFG